MSIWPPRFEIKRMAIVFVPAFILFYALVPLTYYGLLGAKRQNPLHSIMVFDLGGITHFSGENQFPVTWSAEQTALLTSRCYDPVRWDSYWHVPPCPFVMQRLEQPDDLIFGTPRLIEAWRRAVPRIPSPISTSRDLHVAIPRPLEPGAAGLGLARPPNAAYGQAPCFQAAASRSTTRYSRRCCFGRGSGSCLRSRSAPCLAQARAPAGAFAVASPLRP